MLTRFSPRGLIAPIYLKGDLVRYILGLDDQT